MKGILLFWVGLPLLATSYETQDCYQVGFVEKAWNHLISNEPKIVERLEQMRIASHYQGAILPTKCEITYPVSLHGEEIDGFRTVVMKRTWTEGSDQHLMAMKFVYREETVWEGAIQVIRRPVYSFLYCDGRSCDAFGIGLEANETNPPLPFPGIEPDVPPLPSHYPPR